ncbi:MAG: hypothetical protein AUI14_06255 [Actinobacteria bacterium 13_2_20CM_2_71_6]|nr:MAG: hypothetical protein AUI14_06255 [Actinobacteria bacterium 13_2_20CM_2_71_6]
MRGADRAGRGRRHRRGPAPVMKTDVGTEAVRALYTGRSDVTLTWQRRSVGARAETETVRRILRQWLPPAPADVVDVGGGNGFFAFELTGTGYRVRLSDLTEALIDDARRRADEQGQRLVAIDVADARRLPYADRSADAALFFGPMYGLQSPADRALALAEVRRILRPAGVLVVESLTKAGGLRNLAHRDPAALTRIDIARFVEDGVIAGPDLPRFYDGHVFLDPDDVAAELTAAGLDVLDTVAVDGPHPLRQRTLAGADPAVVSAWADLALYVGRQRSYWAAANHMLHVTRLS